MRLLDMDALAAAPMLNDRDVDYVFIGVGSRRRSASQAIDLTKRSRGQSCHPRHAYRCTKSESEPEITVASQRLRRAPDVTVVPVGAKAAAGCQLVAFQPLSAKVADGQAATKNGRTHRQS